MLLTESAWSSTCFSMPKGQGWGSRLKEIGGRSRKPTTGSRAKFLYLRALLVCVGKVLSIKKVA